MKIQKVFSESSTNERIYSVLLTEEELRFFSELQKEFAYTGTRYDITDKYKTMKDSDILAEKKRSNSESYIHALKSMIKGMGYGAAANVVYKMIMGGKKAPSGFTNKMDAALAESLNKSTIMSGASLGGLIGLAKGLGDTHEEREDNRFANDRLEKAKYQAKRRERKNWKDSITNRDDYSF